MPENVGGHGKIIRVHIVTIEVGLTLVGGSIQPNRRCAFVS